MRPPANWRTSWRVRLANWLVRPLGLKVRLPSALEIIEDRRRGA